MRVSAAVLYSRPCESICLSISFCSHLTHFQQTNRPAQTSLTNVNADSLTHGFEWKGLNESGTWQKHTVWCGCLRHESWADNEELRTLVQAQQKSLWPSCLMETCWLICWYLAVAVESSLPRNSGIEHHTPFLYHKAFTQKTILRQSNFCTMCVCTATLEHLAVFTLSCYIYCNIFTPNSVEAQNWWYKIVPFHCLLGLSGFSCFLRGSQSLVCILHERSLRYDSNHDSNRNDTPSETPSFPAVSNSPSPCQVWIKC